MIVRTLVALFAVVIAANALAQPERAQNLDQLLEMIKRSQISESAEHRQREAEFARDKANQARLVEQAKVTREQLEARAAELERLYSEQQ
ncbi:MAG TPA: energy transducer TonB, partial [Cellvibrio sp.]